MTRDRAVNLLLLSLLIGTVVSIATDLPQPWRALAWLLFIACCLWTLWCLWRIERLR